MGLNGRSRMERTTMAGPCEKSKCVLAAFGIMIESRLAAE